MAEPTLSSPPTEACRTQRVVLADGERTWTVVDAEHGVVEPVEQYLEYLRMLGRSPNTVKSYARGLALWWEFLAVYGLQWDGVTVEDFGRFLGWLRTGDSPAVVSIERRPARFSEGTVALRLQAVCSLYRYHHFNGVETASRLYERVFSGRHPYKPMLEHLARRRGHDRRIVRLSRPRPKTPPTLTPEQVRLILDACASWDPAAREWRGSVRDRLLWALLAESGMRLGEALAIKHGDGTPASAILRSLRWCRARITRMGCGSRTAATARSSSPMSLTASTASTSGGCATPAPTTRSTISTRTGCS
jgi:site-specific recombinase XerD